jgi:hypothetical protein
MTDIINNIKDTLEDSLLKENLHTNLGKTERILSAAAGTYIALKGLGNIFSHPLIATGELLIAYNLLNRGLTGYCPISERLEREDCGPEPVLIVKENVVL